MRPSYRGAILAFTVAAGAVDAATYLGLGQVFTANMTGNSVLLAIAVAEGSSGAAARSGAALVGFCAGVALGAFTRDPHENQPWPARVAVPLVLGVLALAALGIGWGFAGARPVGGARYGLIVASALAMGLQSAATRAAPMRGISTTYMTGTLTRAVEGAISRLRPRAEEREEAAHFRAGTWIFYICGALGGAFAERAWHAGAVVIPFVFTAGVAVAGVVLSFGYGWSTTAKRPSHME